VDGTTHNARTTTTIYCKPSSSADVRYTVCHFVRRNNGYLFAFGRFVSLRTRAFFHFSPPKTNPASTQRRQKKNQIHYRRVTRFVHRRLNTTITRIKQFVDRVASKIEYGTYVFMTCRWLSALYFRFLSSLSSHGKLYF